VAAIHANELVLVLMVSGLMVYYDGCGGDLNEFLGRSKEVLERPMDTKCLLSPALSSKGGERVKHCISKAEFSPERD
jgi:hypothetical protein